MGTEAKSQEEPVRDITRAVTILPSALGFASFLAVMDFLLWGAAFSPVDGVSLFPWSQIHLAYSIPNIFSLGLSLVVLAGLVPSSYAARWADSHTFHLATVIGHGCIVIGLSLIHI